MEENGHVTHVCEPKLLWDMGWDSAYFLVGVASGFLFIANSPLSKTRTGQAGVVLATAKDPVRDPVTARIERAVSSSVLGVSVPSELAHMV